MSVELRVKYSWSVARAVIVAILLGFALIRSANADGPDGTVFAGEPVKIAEGFGAIEGPAWDRAGTLYFSSLSDGRVYRWSEKEGARVFCQLEGRCNGLRFDKDGNLLICQPGARRLLRVTPEGKREVVVERHAGGRLNSPNDIWVAPDGGIYFTDPRYGKGGELEQDGPFVYYLAPGEKEPIAVIKGLQKPNGVVGTADGKTLFVGDPKEKKVYSYEIRENGAVAKRKLAADTKTDGLAVDDRGNLYTTGKTIRVYSPQAALVAEIEMPAGVSNITFGGENDQTLFCTSRAGIFAIAMNVRDGSDPFKVARDPQR